MVTFRAVSRFGRVILVSDTRSSERKLSAESGEDIVKASRRVRSKKAISLSKYEISMRELHSCSCRVFSSCQAFSARIIRFLQTRISTVEREGQAGQRARQKVLMHGYSRYQPRLPWAMLYPCSPAHYLPAILAKLKSLFGLL